MTPTSTPTPLPPPICAIRLDYANPARDHAQVEQQEAAMQAAGVNLVALGAGRLDWTFFKWQGYASAWSSDVRDTGVDFLAEDSARFNRWASVSAVVDVLAPRYIQAHPGAAARNRLGQASPNLVSTTELAHGEFGRQLVELIEAIAAGYPVDSISITELAYYTDGYGDDDRASYMAYTGRPDWPRSFGLVNIDDPSIGKWRSHEIGLFLSQAAAAAHKHQKQLYMDVDVSWGHLERESVERGQDYGVMLQSADRLVVWDYFGLSGYRPEYTTELARSLSKYGRNRVILSVGLWGKGGSIVSPDAMRLAMQAALQSEIPNLWITPSLYLTPDHWRVLSGLWKGK